MAEVVKLLKFGSEYCGPCQDMARKKTLEKFGAKHPEVTVTKYDLPEAPEVDCLTTDCGEVGLAGEECDGCGQTLPDGPTLSPEEQKVIDLADKLEVESIPCVIFMRGETVLARADEQIGLKEIEALYKQALDE